MNLSGSILTNMRHISFFKRYELYWLFKKAECLIWEGFWKSLSYSLPLTDEELRLTEDTQERV